MKHIQNYINLVRSGKLEVCKEQKQLCDLVEKVLNEEDIYINEEQVEKYLALEKYFNFDLLEWEKFCFVLHNCCYKKDGTPRFSDLILYVGRGSGKNGYLSFEDFALLTHINPVKNYHIDICANSEEQAKTSFNEITEVLNNNKAKLSKHFKWNAEKITNLKTGSVLSFRTSSSKSADGGRQGKVDFDEYHQYENYKLIEVYTSGLGKKEHSRRTIATSDGDVRDGPLDELLIDGRNVLSGSEADNGQLFFICHIENEAEAHEEKKWSKANPSLHKFTNLQTEMKRHYQLWRKNPTANASFITKRLNYPQGKKTEGVTSWENILAGRKPLPSLEGKKCVFGLDFMLTTDFLCAGLLFDVDGEKFWKSHSWYCSNSKDLARIKFPLEKAEKLGLITKINDVEISPEIPIKWLKDQQQYYKIVAGAVDSFRFSVLKRELSSIGFNADKTKGSVNLKLARPSDLIKIAPQILSDFNNQRICYGDDFLMSWYINNVSVTTDKNSNVIFGKIEPKTRKTDGFKALEMAYTLIEEVEEKSYNLPDNLFDVIEF